MAKARVAINQKRVPKGHTGGGRWTKGNIGFGGALGADADNAMAAFQDYRKTRVKLAKRKRKFGASPTKQQRVELMRLQTQMNAHKATFDAARKKAMATGVKITANGDVIAGGKQYAKAGKVLIKPAGGKSATGTPQGQPSQPKPPSQSQQIQDGIDAFKEHRKWRVKAIALNKRVKAGNATTAHVAALNQAVQKRDAAKAKLDTIRKSLNASGQVKFKSNGDVFVKGVQTHKGGTPIAAVKKKAVKPPAKQKQAAKPVVPSPKPTGGKQSQQPPIPKRPPRRFYNLQKAHQFKNKYYSNWVNGLTKAEAEAITDYIGFPTYMHRPGKDPKIYSKLNHALAGDTKMTRKLRQMAKHIDSALEKTSTPYDIVVHRGLNSQAVYNAVKNGTIDDNVLNSPKATKRYISTSLEPNTADVFMNYKPGVGFTYNAYPVRWEIEVPKGAMGAAISFSNQLNNPYANQSSEFLLPRDTTFELVSAKIAVHPDTGQHVAYIKARIKSQKTH